ncbi:MAG: Jag N-terminal domain-containing protein, partial [Clostridia bacterium]|nr:Jag N-terminal domain-containing protein [Clostridia bacterium]
MFKRVEAVGKTTEDAIRAALAALGCTREEAEIEELVKPRSGFFGIGSVEAKVAATYTYKPVEIAKEFLSGLLERMGVSADMEITPRENGGINVNLTGSGMGAIIGRRGETLDAIQHLTN